MSVFIVERKLTRRRGNWITFILNFMGVKMCLLI